MRKIIPSLFIISIFLAACSGLTPTAPVVITENSPINTPGSSEPYPYPEPIISPTPPISAYPPPSTASPIIPVIPPSGYEPQPGDENLTRDEPHLELENSSLVIKDGFPVQVEARLAGSLPDPCHQLRVVVTLSDGNDAINLEVYSLVDTSKGCITVIAPYEAVIPLGSFTSGEFVINVNGQLLGEFGVGYQPQPGDDQLTGDQVTLELDKSEISVTGTPPVQVNVKLVGYLSDPCHQLRVVSSGADENKVINLKAYSLFSAGGNCITVIKPFTAIIPLGVFPIGHYTIMVNDEVLGEFDG